MNVSLVSSHTAASRRTWCPTKDPRAPTPLLSHRSAATRSATVKAATRLGCVQTIRQEDPAPRSIASSNKYCGTCVVFPEPVSPHTTHASCASSAAIRDARSFATGNVSRNARIFAHAASPSLRFAASDA
jgi:hypothetical protein